VDPHKEEEQDELVRELIAKQRELEQLEKGLEPTLRMLLGKVVDERMEYESSEAMRKRQEEKMIMLENQKMLERRKEMDMAWQKQLEQDMDAVCDICNDGEVAPDNQILFCESCNVAVHQMCYGIDHVPEGDYYCLACRHLGRNRGAVSRDPDAPKVAAAPLPICCELCPLKQGAFMRTNMNSKKGEEVAFGKWVHVICAKWQGLNFVDSRKPDLIEDVAELKMNFRRYGFTCQLCEGDRGAMNLGSMVVPRGSTSRVLERRGRAMLSMERMLADRSRQIPGLSCAQSTRISIRLMFQKMLSRRKGSLRLRRNFLPSHCLRRPL
jgi:hypothetical protein